MISSQSIIIVKQKLDRSLMFRHQRTNAKYFKLQYTLPKVKNKVEFRNFRKLPYSISYLSFVLLSEYY